MGVKTTLRLEEINKVLKDDISFKDITPTSFGATDTVYICDDTYILKLYELSSIEQLNQEIKLHQELSKLKISKLFKEKIYMVKNKPCLIFEKSNGIVIDDVKETHLKQIVSFLKEFHSISKDIQTQNKDIFSQNYLKELILKTQNKEFLEIFNSLKIEFKNDGLIHGDLFVDNALFKNDILDAVIDFNEACRGDFIFDLAVIVMSWCSFNKEEFSKDFDTLISNYDKSLDINKLIEYTKYACLYYCVTRSLENRDYSDLMTKYEFLVNLKG